MYNTARTRATRYYESPQRELEEHPKSMSTLFILPTAPKVSHFLFLKAAPQSCLPLLTEDFLNRQYSVFWIWRKEHCLGRSWHVINYSNWCISAPSKKRFKFTFILIRCYLSQQPVVREIYIPVPKMHLLRVVPVRNSRPHEICTEEKVNTFMSKAK